MSDKYENPLCQRYASAKMQYIFSDDNKFSTWRRLWITLSETQRELFGGEADALREAGVEYGAATGRPRRVGGFDIPASRYGIEVQGADELALTKLDVLSYLDKIPVCVAYEIDGVRTNRFPTGDRLMRAKPVYGYLDGFKTDISKCRSVEDLPDAAIKYISIYRKRRGLPYKVCVCRGRA